MIAKRRVVCYITWKDNQLVFMHLDFSDVSM